MAGLLLPICSTIFSCLLCLVYFSKKRIKLLENSMYSIMIVCSVLDSILVSILQFIVQYQLTYVSKYFLFLLNKLDFILLIVICNSLFFYIILITFKKAKEKFYNFLIPAIIIDIIAIIIISLTNLELINSNNNFSIIGTSANITYLLCGIYVILTIIVVLTNLKKIDRRHIPVFAIMIIFIFLFIIYKINPYLIVISISLTFINYIMYFTIENPDVKMIEQLNIAKDQAEKANSAKTEFLSNMSHEIRTPLNAIVGFSECLVNSDIGDENKEFAHDIVDASNNLLEIVNGILDISKIEANKMEIIKKEYNPREVFNSLSKLIIPRIGEKPIEFKMNIAPDLPGVLKGDMSKLKQIVLNLLTNAAKYTDKGEIEFIVNCINRTNTKSCILNITVKDTGRGIKEKDIKKLFTKFERIDEDKNTTIEGTGLGLAITKKLTEMMGGKITVQSIYESGSTFRVTLEQEIISMEIPESNSEEIEINYDLHKGKNILIVDDSKINLKVASQILKPYNFNIKLANSGYEAIELVDSQTFDLILMDIMMPKMNGIETLRRLKKIEGFDIPVIALTADALEGMDEKYKSAGFDEYLSKPIDRHELDHILNQFLDKKKEQK